MVSELVTLEEKRQALARVVASKTFSRSDQLRSFLRYICEAEFEGRAQELNEYVLGVSVLGRPQDYSPAEDSCVRTRAYELRNKLKLYYRLEAPDEPVQIDIRKGAYIPQFQRMAEVAMPEPVSLERAPLPVQPRRNFLRPALLFALVLAAIGIYFYSTRAKAKGGAAEISAWTPELAAFWKPFLNEGTPLVVSFEIRLFFFSPSTGLVVRDYQTNQLAELEKSAPLADFRKRMEPGALQETSDYADFGAVHAAFLIGRLLGSRHSEIGLKHSDSLGWEDIRNSNVIFIGKPNLNPTIRRSLEGANFTEDELGVVRNQHPLAGERSEYRSASTHGSGVKYALITVMPGPQSGHHIMILSGAGSEFLWALAECVTDAAHVKELVSHLRTPSGDLPAGFQVLIETTFDSNVPIKIRYVTHRAL